MDFESVVWAKENKTLVDAYKTDTHEVSGVLEIADKFDAIIFSIENTLIKNGMTLPSSAALIPQLRKLGKKLGIFSSTDSYSREELTKKVNYHGFSFSSERILLREDLSDLSDKFPLVAQRRILMVCSDLTSEVNIAHNHQLATLYITDINSEPAYMMGIEPDFVSLSV